MRGLTVRKYSTGVGGRKGPPLAGSVAPPGRASNEFGGRAVCGWRFAR